MKKKKDNTLLIVIIVIAILAMISMFINMIFSNNNNNITNNRASVSTSNSQNTITTENIETDRQEKILTKLKNMTERDRMEYYFGTFVSKLDEKDYESAYNMLYEEYRKTYFPSMSSFKEYVQEIYSGMTSVEYNNIERNGDIYILWVTINDLNGKSVEIIDEAEVSTGKEVKVVIREYGYNDFVMSFSAE